MKAMDRTLNPMVSEACAHMESADVTRAQRQDGEKIAFVVLVATKKEEKKQDRAAEESHVLTEESILVAEMMESKYWQEARTSHDRWQSKFPRDNGARKAEKDRGGKK